MTPNRRDTGLVPEKPPFSGVRAPPAHVDMGPRAADRKKHQDRASQHVTINPVILKTVPLCSRMQIVHRVRGGRSTPGGLARSALDRDAGPITAHGKGTSRKLIQRRNLRIPIDTKSDCQRQKVIAGIDQGSRKRLYKKSRTIREKEWPWI